MLFSLSKSLGERERERKRRTPNKQNWTTDFTYTYAPYKLIDVNYVGTVDRAL